MDLLWLADGCLPRRDPGTTYEADHPLNATATPDAFTWLASRIGTR